MINFSGVKIVQQCQNILSGIGKKHPSVGKITADTFSSHNLLHFLKKRLYTVDEITYFVEKLSDEERYVGCLPDRWREKFDDANIKEGTLQIQKILSDFAKTCSSGRETPMEFLSPEARELAQAFQRYLGECTVTPVRKGTFGKVFRIQGGGEDLALKIYHNNPIEYLLSTHGQTVEVANAIHLNHVLKPNQCSRFYCAKMELPKNEGAFMLTEFVKESNTPQPLDPWTLWDYGYFHFSDTKDANFINGKVVDYGGISYNFDSYNEMKYAKKLYPLIQGCQAKEILKLREKYTGDKDFDKLISKARKLMETINRMSGGKQTEKQLETCKALYANINKTKKGRFDKFIAFIKAGFAK